MNAPDLTDDEHLGLYLRNTDSGAEWWRVSVADRPQTYRLEHATQPAEGNAAVDIDLVVDAENLRAKLKKWHREGFTFEARGSAPQADAQQRAAFMPELRARGDGQAPRGRSPATRVKQTQPLELARAATCLGNRRSRHRAYRRSRRAVRRRRPAGAARQPCLSVLGAL